MDDQNNTPQIDPQPTDNTQIAPPEPVVEETSKAPVVEEPVAEFVPPVVPENLEEKNAVEPAMDVKEEISEQIEVNKEIIQDQVAPITHVMAENTQVSVETVKSDVKTSEVEEVTPQNQSPEVVIQEEEIPSVEVGPEDNQDAQVISEEPITNTSQTTLPEKKVETETISAEKNSARPAGFKPKTSETPMEKMEQPVENPVSEQTAAPKIQWKKPVITMLIISAIAIGIMILLNNMY